MEDLTIMDVFDDARIEILPPDRGPIVCDTAPACLCCGRQKVIEEDCCGICDECLAP
jgi:hypothetical protein